MENNKRHSSSDAIDRNVEIWKMKKLIKNLQLASG
jgi:hypothetical protein